MKTRILKDDQKLETFPFFIQKTKKKLKGDFHRVMDRVSFLYQFMYNLINDTHDQTYD